MFLDILPVGVSLQILDAINKIAILTTKPKQQIWNGFNIVINPFYPFELPDGRVIDAVMVGANGSRCYLIRESKQ